MELRNLTDAELLEAFVSGHEASFAVFMPRHLLPLQRWLRLTLSEDADVDDVVQETFQAVVHQAHTFQGENARAWLFGIGRRKAYRLFRRRSGEPEHFVELDELALKAGWGSPESALHEAQDREFLKKCFDAWTQRPAKSLFCAMWKNSARVRLPRSLVQPYPQ